MADVKKDAKKEGPKKASKVEDVLLLIIGIVVIFFVLLPQIGEKPSETNQNIQGTSQTTGRQLQSSQNQTEPFGSIKAFYNSIFKEKTEQVTDSRGRKVEVVSGPSLINETQFRAVDIIKNIFIFIIILTIFLSIVFGFVWYFNMFRLKVVKEEYAKKIGVNVAEDVPDEVLEAQAPVGLPGEVFTPDVNGLHNPKWELIEKYYNSGNQAEWRIAIIEADILLFEVLQTSGFPGETLGEILKGIDQSKLQTIQTAWKSHLIRNKLAHEGASVPLSRQTVESAIEGYRAVFNELNFI